MGKHVEVKEIYFDEKMLRTASGDEELKI